MSSERTVFGIIVFLIIACIFLFFVDDYTGKPFSVKGEITDKRQVNNYNNGHAITNLYLYFRTVEGWAGYTSCGDADFAMFRVGEKVQIAGRIGKFTGRCYVAQILLLKGEF